MENNTKGIVLVCLVKLNDYITGRQHRHGRIHRRGVRPLPETWPIPSANHIGFQAGNVALRSSILWPCIYCSRMPLTFWSVVLWLLSYWYSWWPTA